jgi:thiamine-phosphate pyrophosphorylase
MTEAPRLKGLYAITDPSLCPDKSLADQVEAALKGGASVIQFRDKRPEREIRKFLASQLLSLCNKHQALLIINDDLSLAQEIGAHGVHLGRDDADIHQARESLGEQAIIGISCYNRLELAQSAVENGADYVAFGRFYPSSTKPEAVQATPELLQLAKQQIDRPLVAIGGITPENGAPLIEAGADMLAVIHGVFGQADVRNACQQMTNLFEPKEKST